MKFFLIALLVFIVWSVFGLWMYSLAASPNTTTTKDVAKISEKIEGIPLKDTDTLSITSEIINPEIKSEEKNFVISSLDDVVIFESNQTIVIQKNNPEISLPQDLLELPSILAEYLEVHPGHELHIKSYYSPSASLQTPNVGQQRGEYLKETLLDLGVNVNQIVVNPIISTEDFDENDMLNNGMTFAFKLLNRERIANAKTAIPEEIIFYPSYNFDDLLANQKLTDLTNQVVSIHEENPNLSITVVGHTDHIGASSENYIRGLKASRQIRWYLINKGGITRDLVTAISKGESEPLLRDGRPASRKENARIGIKFSEEK